MFAPGQHNHVKLTNVHHALCFVHWGAGALWIVSMRFRKVLCLMLRRCKVYWWESRGTLLRKSVFQPFPAFLNPFQSICKFPIVFKWQVLKIGSERILQNGSSLSLSHGSFRLNSLRYWKNISIPFLLFSTLLSTSVIISPCSQYTF